MSKSERILVMSHAHPDFSLGGGEIAAYNIFKAFKNHPGVEEAWFLGRADKGRGATGRISLRRENEYLWEQAVHDWHMMKAVHQESLVTWFADLIKALRPTVVHTHHYAHLGLEYLRVIKQVNPAIQIVMTLHEYMAICEHNGQMIKTGAFKLCTRESFDECRQCYPSRAPEDFWLRKHYFLSHFELVDQFVSPSEFLRQRYIAWGIAPEKIVVIENGQSDEPALPPRPLAAGETRNRFAYFGQINPFKGLPVVLEALHTMEEEDLENMVLEVHGANLEQQSGELQEKVKRLVDPLIQTGVVRWMGSYRPDELSDRMANVDWVLVPSIWWENSPMVIQEAFVCGRPVICSNIGGMAEKVKHGQTGLHVPAGNVLQWANTFAKASNYSKEWDKLRQQIVPPLTHRGCADVHLKLFK